MIWPEGLDAVSGPELLEVLSIVSVARLLGAPNIILSMRRCARTSLSCNGFVNVQHGEPYSTTGETTLSNSRNRSRNLYLLFTSSSLWHMKAFHACRSLWSNSISRIDSKVAMRPKYLTYP